MQGCHLWQGRGAGRVYGPPRIYDFSFFCKSYFWNSVTAAKTICYADLNPKDHWDPNDLLKWRPWRDATADNGINDQLIKMHCTHSWIKWVLSSSISYFVVHCFQCKMFDTTKLLNPMVSFVELITHKWAIWYW